MAGAILLVDDSIPLHRLVEHQLEADQIKLHSAYDGESALALAASHRPDLILMDVDLPQLDGFEACRRLQTNPATANIPIIFLSADSLATDKVKGLDMGAMDYITKPFKPQELRARVRAALRSKHDLDAATMIDGLTGLWNGSYFQIQLTAKLSLARRTGRPLACIVADIDHLDAINASRGRDFGNEVLRSVGRVLLGQLRGEDTVCRLDGGCFAMLVPGANRAGAAHLTDRLREQIQRQLQPHGWAAGVTCSFGVADTHIADDATILDRARTAVGRAKQSGRNRVCIARHLAEEEHAAA
jgi:two-component system, cell cycle response regulator